MRTRPRQGPVPGTKLRIRNKTAKQDAMKMASLVHGRRAKVATMRDVRRKQLSRLQKGAPEIFDAYEEAIVNGKPEALEPFAAIAMAETEVLRRAAVDDVAKKGIRVKTVIGMDSSGKAVVTERINPALDHAQRFNEQLGYTATDLMLTKKSRGDMVVNAMLAQAMARDEKLRRMDRKLIPPPADED